MNICPNLCLILFSFKSFSGAIIKRGTSFDVKNILIQIKPPQEEWVSVRQQKINLSNFGFMFMAAANVAEEIDDNGWG